MYPPDYMAGVWVLSDPATNEWTFYRASKTWKTLQMTEFRINIEPSAKIQRDYEKARD